MIMEIEADSNLFPNATQMNSDSTKASSNKAKDFKFDISKLNSGKRICSPKCRGKFSSISKEDNIISFNNYFKRKSMFDFEFNYEECLNSLDRPHCPHNTSQYLIRQYQNERKNSNEEEYEFQEVCFAGSILAKENEYGLSSTSIDEIALDLDYEEEETSNPNLSPMENYSPPKRISSKFRRKRINSCNS